MSSYEADILWERGSQVFSDGRYSRGHDWRFDGGTVVPASSSPHVRRCVLRLLVPLRCTPRSG
jgi:hypothetical protein